MSNWVDSWTIGKKTQRATTLRKKSKSKKAFTGVKLALKVEVPTQFSYFDHSLVFWSYLEVGKSKWGDSNGIGKETWRAPTLLKTTDSNSKVLMARKFGQVHRQCWFSMVLFPFHYIYTHICIHSWYTTFTIMYIPTHSYDTTIYTPNIYNQPLT